MISMIKARHVIGVAVSVAFLAFGTASHAADSVQGTIAKVEEDGKFITVKDKDGKETKIKISNKRTKMEGASDSAELKAGQTVSVTYKDGEATELSVKAK